MTELLVSHPIVKIYYTPTYSFWLSQDELWFAKIKWDIPARGIFTSLSELRKKLVKYIRSYNDKLKPINWPCDDKASRISAS